jgi:hypothetical protein
MASTSRDPRPSDQKISAEGIVPTTNSDHAREALRGGQDRL